MKRLLCLSFGLACLSACQTNPTRLPEVPPYAVPEDAQGENEDEAGENLRDELPTSSDDAVDSDGAASGHDGDLWHRISGNFSIDLPTDSASRAEIDKQLRFFRKNSKTVKSSLNRAAPYLYLVVKELEKRDLPMELALLPIIESSYNPKAVGGGGAAGLWQFMPATGKVLGLKKNAYYDGKHDVFASTQAALDYMEMLGKKFDGDWALALAAYNAGYGSVQRAQAANRARGKDDDFWDLNQLRSHTREYVPKLLALAEMLKHPGRYNLEWEPVSTDPVMRKVDLNKPIALSEAAAMANVSLEEMVALNPGFAKPWAVTGGPGYLMLPEEKAGRFAEKVKQLPSVREQDGPTHTVQAGETLSAIAKRYRIKPELLRQANHLYGTRDPKVGRRLKIPSAANSAFDTEAELVDTATSAQPAATRRHTVKSGETLWKVARQYQLSVDALAKANGLNTKSALKVGAKLKVPAKASLAQTKPGSKDRQKAASAENPHQDKQTLRYTVKAGDSLGTIAERHKISLKELLSWNKKLDPKKLKPGQALLIYVPERASSVSASS